MTDISMGMYDGLKIYKDKSIGPKELSRFLKSQDFKEKIAENYPRIYEKWNWRHLIGNIMTCPWCGGEAVIITIGLDVSETIINSSCYCRIDQQTSDIFSYWCAKKFWGKQPIFPIHGEVDLSDTCKLFSQFINDSHEF